ncbi:hypothetical protein CSIM01_00535 [Colletotrichum simmondsii]|uniref:Uncharacterized protein n=1 Tax=Colletotrichum simmondsii TaxID=703756 RepID=A0A135SIW2_9PEZI|nr:hypothetical protein CSIM01_00535 [Colletotrichum simmondsii]
MPSKSLHLWSTCPVPSGLRSTQERHYTAKWHVDSTRFSLAKGFFCFSLLSFHDESQARWRIMDGVAKPLYAPLATWQPLKGRLQGYGDGGGFMKLAQAGSTPHVPTQTLALQRHLPSSSVPSVTILLPITEEGALERLWSVPSRASDQKWNMDNVPEKVLRNYSAVSRLTPPRNVPNIPQCVPNVEHPGFSLASGTILQAPIRAFLCYSWPVSKPAWLRAPPAPCLQDCSYSKPQTLFAKATSRRLSSNLDRPWLPTKMGYNFLWNTIFHNDGFGHTMKATEAYEYRVTSSYRQPTRNPPAEACSRSLLGASDKAAHQTYTLACHVPWSLLSVRIHTKARHELSTTIPGSLEEVTVATGRCQQQELVRLARITRGPEIPAAMIPPPVPLCLGRWHDYTIGEDWFGR